MRAREFKRDPEERRQQTRIRDAFSSCDEDHAHGERGPDDSSGDSEKTKDPGGEPRIDIAILAHHRGNPGKADGIEHESMEKTVKRSFASGRADGCEDEHADRNPRKQRQIVIWKRQRQEDATPQSEKNSRLPAECHLALDYRLEAGLFESALGSVGGFFVGIRTDLNAVEIVGGGRNDERRKSFLLDSVGHGKGVALASESGDLQNDRALTQFRRLETG